MIDLKLSSGLPIKYDEVGDTFEFGEGVIFDQVNKVPLRSMLPGLLNKSLRYPEYVYTEHKNVRHKSHDGDFQKHPYNYDLVRLPAGLMGVEYIRSHVFYTKSESDQVSVSEIVEVLNGRITILLQRNHPQEQEIEFYKSVSEGYVVRLEKGEKFAIPTDYYYTFINTGDEPGIFTRFYRKECKCDYSEFRKEKGLAYFAIKKNAKEEIVTNPRYKNIPQLKEKPIKELDHCDRIGIDKKKSLYEQVVTKPENSLDLV